jgi:hypothetical protein
MTSIRNGNTMKQDTVRLLLLCGLGVAATQASSHHAASIHYDVTDVAEVEGRVTEIEWANPHSVITLVSDEDDGTQTEWRIEAAAAAMIMRSGMTRDTLSIGDTIQASGYRGRRNSNAIFMRNILLEDGREWRASKAVRPLWTDNLVDTASASKEEPQADARSGIFRVWSVDASTLPETGPPRPLWNDSYPLTDMAREIQATWGRSVENPYVNCRNGMPAIMDTPIPMEFAREGGNIVLHFEELDARRRILMGDDGLEAPVVPGPYGHSVGRWEGDSLVVRTTAIDWEWFDQDGIPLTDDVVITERFTPGAEGRFLYYIATVIDDDVFTEPVVLDRRFAFLANEQVQSYDCTWNETGL